MCEITDFLEIKSYNKRLTASVKQYLEETYLAKIHNSVQASKKADNDKIFTEGLMRVQIENKKAESFNIYYYDLCQKKQNKILLTQYVLDIVFIDTKISIHYHYDMRDKHHRHFHLHNDKFDLKSEEWVHNKKRTKDKGKFQVLLYQYIDKVGMKKFNHLKDESHIEVFADTYNEEDFENINDVKHERCIVNMNDYRDINLILDKLHENLHDLIT